MSQILISREEVNALIGEDLLQQLATVQVKIVGLRGFLETDGPNKRGIYDDCIILITPEAIMPVKANTDPSITRKGVAVLQDGVYWYKRGLHGVHHLNLGVVGDKLIMGELLRTNKDVPPIPGRLLPYWALRQDSPVTILRDGAEKPETVIDPGNWPWIDIHRGGNNTTSSEGCQTIQPDAWPDFRDAAFKAMKDYNQPRVPYILRTKKA